MKIAFSTIACPDWTLADATTKAADLGYLGLEMRSFHDGSKTIASDPLTMEPDAIDALFDDAGVVPMSLATGIRYDKPINPPLIGRMFVNEEEGVGETKAYVDLADRAGIRFVRVFGCHLPAAEPRTWSMRRVSERLKLAAQTCRNTDVRLLIENAGSFTLSTDLLRLIQRVDVQWLGASFNILASKQSGEDPVEGVRTLKDHLQVVKLSDVDADGYPVRLGEGVMPVRETIAALQAMNYSGWVVYEYPRLWHPTITEAPADVLRHAADRLYEWTGAVPGHC